MKPVIRFVIALLICLICCDLVKASEKRDISDTSIHTDIYALSILAINGDSIRFSEFQNKFILVVNIASQSPDTSQIIAFEQLYQQYKDSLVIIAIPGNSFNNEPNADDDDLNYLYRNFYGINYYIGAVADAKGEFVSPVFQWLSTKSQNGTSDNEILSDFQKFLIDKNGNLVAVFAPEVNPLSTEITQAINSAFLNP